MTANEVNDIVMRLLAAADHIRGREREEILHHVGRLSRAAVRERTAAVDEMQRLRKKIVQQSADLKRIENASKMPAAPATQASKASQPPTVRSTVALRVESMEIDTSICRAAASGASLKAAFRRLLPVLHLLSTMGLTMVACHALAAFPSRIAGLLLQIADLFCLVVSSDLPLRVHLLHLPASPKTLLFRSSLVSATSTRLVSSHSRLGRSSRHRLAMLMSAPLPRKNLLSRRTR